MRFQLFHHFSPERLWITSFMCQPLGIRSCSADVEFPAFASICQICYHASLSSCLKLKENLGKVLLIDEWMKSHECDLIENDNLVLFLYLRKVLFKGTAAEREGKTERSSVCYWPPLKCPGLARQQQEWGTSSGFPKCLTEAQTLGQSSTV